MTVGADSPLVWNPKVASRTLEDTAFVLVHGRMVTLNSVGTRVWELFERAATPRQVSAAIEREFETTAEQALSDVQSFAASLLERELLILAFDAEPRA